MEEAKIHHHHQHQPADQVVLTKPNQESVFSHRCRRQCLSYSFLITDVFEKN